LLPFFRLNEHIPLFRETAIVFFQHSLNGLYYCLAVGLSVPGMNFPYKVGANRFSDYLLEFFSWAIEYLFLEHEDLPVPYFTMFAYNKKINLKIILSPTFG
jgi:hypothetical protein